MLNRMSYELLTVEREDTIALLSLNRPQKRNALSIALQEEITRCLGQLEEEAGVKVLVITGRGSAFCAGFDLSEVAVREPAHAQRLNRTSELYHRALLNFPKPIVAGVNGPALAGGFDLALACDIRIASEKATFGHPEVKFGVAPLYLLLKEIAGEAIARDLCLSGRMIDVQEALRLGLVSRIVPGEKLLEEAMSSARQVAEAPLPALIRTKRGAIAASAAARTWALDAGRDAFAEVDPSKMRPAQ